MLNRELFTSLAEAKLLASEYRDEYNHRRPHSALGYQTPAEFAAAQFTSGSAPPDANCATNTTNHFHIHWYIIRGPGQ